MGKFTYTKSERWTLLCTILASSMVFIDGTALNVAMPALQEDLSLTGSQLLWVVNAYALFLSALLLPGGAMGDQFGRNRIFSIGLLIFMVSSLVCGISSSSLQLIAARAFQGIGGALLIPGSLSILTARFPAEKVGGAIGLWSTFSAMTAIIGPVLGGWLADVGLWRVIFFINIPFSLFVLWAIFKHVEESKNPDAQKLDIGGAIFATIGLGGITYGFIESANKWFNDPLIISSLAVGGVASIAFITSQAFGKHPMMPLKLFKNINFSVTNIATLFIYGALSATIFFLPLNLVQVQGYSETQAGLATLPSIILITLLSSLSGKISGRTGPKLFLTVGPFFSGLGFFLYGLQGITQGPADYWTTFFIPTSILGLGMGLTVAPLTTTVMSAVSKNNSGIASGVNNTVSRMSGVLSIALMGAMALFYFKTNLMSEASGLNLPAAVLDALEADAINLGGTIPPDTTPNGFINPIKNFVKESFVVAFNRIAFISAGAAWLSSLLSLILLQRKNEIDKQNTKIPKQRIQF